jgi:hypothetical protein
MHILIIGAAGMIGVKLTNRLIKDKGLGGKAIDAVTLVDVVEPATPAGAPFAVTTKAADLSSPGTAAALVADRPDVIFHLAAIVSGEAEADFEKGYRINLDGTRYLFEAIRQVGDGYKPRVVFTSSIAVFGAPVPRCDPRRVPPHAAHLVRRPEGDRRAAALRLHAARLHGRHRHPAADHLRPPRQAEQGGLGLLLRHHPRAARRPGGDPSGRRGRAPLARQPALGRELPGPCRGTGRRRGRPAPQSDHARRLGHGGRADRRAQEGRRRRRGEARPPRARPR